MASISGLATGLDTAGIINQLMQLEKIPQTQLQSKLSSAKTSLASLRTVNSLVASIATQAKDLSDPAKWSPLKATSTLAGLSSSTAANAVSGSWSVQVDRVASTHKMRFADSAALDDVVVTGGTSVSLTINGTTTSIDTGDGTLQGLVNALNASDTGVQASTIRLDDGSHRLVVQSKETGEAQRFTLTDSDGDPLLGGADVVDAQDAAVTVEGQTVHSATNTFTDVLPGVTLSITAETVGKTGEVSVSTDMTTAAKAVKSLIDQVNNVIGQVQTLTGYDKETGAPGLLARDSAVRSVGVALQQAIFPTDGTSLAALGIQTDRNGKLVFDEATFNEALAADPARVAAAITGENGFAARMKKVAEGASDSTNGTLTAAINGRNSTIKSLESSIEAWDLRLELRRTSLERTYSALEVALSNMQSQSNWLAGQLATLPTSSSS